MLWLDPSQSDHTHPSGSEALEEARDRITDRRGPRDLARALEAEHVRQLLAFIAEAEMPPEDVVQVLGPSWLHSWLPA